MFTPRLLFIMERPIHQRNLPACLRSALVAPLVLFTLPALPQAPVVIHGMLRDHDTHRPIPDARVLAIDTLTDALRLEVRTDRTGHYALKLPYDRVQCVFFSAEGHVTKQVIVDLNGPGRKEIEAGYTLDLEMSLMARLDPVDYSAFDRPVAICRYNKHSRDLEWDDAYTALQLPALDALVKAHDARREALLGAAKP